MKIDTTNTDKAAPRFSRKGNGVRQIGHRITAWVWYDPNSRTSPVSRGIQAISRMLFIVWRESERDRITLRASALTFTVVLSLVPMLALGTAVLKGLGYGDQMRQAAYGFIEQLDAPLLPQTATEAPGSPSAPEAGLAVAPVAQADTPPAIAENPTETSLTSHLRRAVDQLFDYVDRTDFAALGTFGILGMVIAALSVLGSIEQSMNTIWQVDSGRPIGRKVIDYLALMILLPLSVNLALATETTLQSPALLSRLHALLPMVWMDKAVLKMLPVIALVATFTLLYRFLPNIRVRFLPALTGGMVGGISWLAVQILFVKLQFGVARYNAIYGSFATLPLLLLWIYVAWVVFLLGAEMAFAAQTMRTYLWKEIVLTPVARLALALELMEAALAEYRARRVASRSTLAAAVGHPETTLAAILNELIRGDKLLLVQGKPDGYVPAAPAEEIRPAEFIDLFFGTMVPELNHCSLARQALDAARDAVADKPIVCHLDPTSVDMT